MVEDTSHILKTIEDYKRDAATKLAEARTNLQIVNSLEDRLGIPRTTLAEIGSEPVQNGAGTPSGPSSLMTSGATRRVSLGGLRPDEYLGMEPLEAAKNYLRSVGHAVHIDEIADAVQRGGAVIQGADWRDRLETSLFRSAYQVVKVQDKTYGLVSFYTEEQVKRLRGSRRAGGSSGRGSGKGTGKGGKKNKGKGRTKAKSTARAESTSKQPKKPAQTVKAESSEVSSGSESEAESIH